MDKEILLDREGLQNALGLRGVMGRCVSSLLYRILALDHLNLKYKNVADLNGPDFSDGTLHELGISYDIIPEQLENIPKEGGFFTVSNHHFGGADGLILNAVVGSRREDFKILTTFLLSQVANLKDCFIPVDNFSSAGTRSVTGIRSALEHIAGGGSLGLFPAGEVATWQKKGRVVEDKPWADNIIKLIRNSGLPVIPIYFDGGNSTLFHVLGRIHPMLRTVRLVREMINKRGTTIKVRIGRPVTAGEMAGMDIPELGKYLRSRCYALEAQCVSSVKTGSQPHVAEIDPPVDPDLVRSQMEKLDDRILFEAGDYRTYLIDASDAPDAMHELYRLREETFRSVGEGTGNPIDTDPYDSYFKHLILWNVPNGEIAGSYRVGFGSKVFAERGLEGFYSASLLRFGPDAGKILSKSLELGRSFISCKYQKEVLPLKLMLTGLTVAVTKDPEATCCVGTVSISNSIPDFYKSLAVYFLKRDFSLPDAVRFAQPTHPFTPGFLRVDPEDLLKVPERDIDAFDKLLWNLSDGQYRLPVLLRKYFSCGAKVSCFNVDPLFFNCLDGMIVLKVADFPPAMLRSIVRPLPKEMQEKVFRHFYGTSLSLLMIRPVHFRYNEQTASNNAFQHRVCGEDVEASVLEEFDSMVRLLKEHDIPVLVVDDTPEPETPDSIFPNNWFSTHEDGTLIIYPMFASNRRKERKPNVIRTIREAARTSRVIDLTGWEERGQFHESTGSMVLDRQCRTAYACRSPRTSETVLNEFCSKMGYSPVLFDAVDHAGRPIYHTNVMMSVGEDIAVICSDVISSPREPSNILGRLRASNKTVVEASFEQMQHYACNVLQVRNIHGESFIIMSDTAMNSLDSGQLALLKEKGSILAAHIPLIEEIGGGSARCMMAELFCPEKS